MPFRPRKRRRTAPARSRRTPTARSRFCRAPTRRWTVRVACLPTDCWFAGGALPDEQIGSFHLHWDGHEMEAEPGPQGHAVSAIVRFGPVLYEGVTHRKRGSRQRRRTAHRTVGDPRDRADRGATQVRLAVPDRLLAGEQAPADLLDGEAPEALAGPLLGSDEGALWAAFDPVSEVSKSTSRGGHDPAREPAGRMVSAARDRTPTPPKAIRSEPRPANHQPRRAGPGDRARATERHGSGGRERTGAARARLLLRTARRTLGAGGCRDDRL